ncbi:MAG: valine--tRNA ligase [Xanthomonadales bacterium]|nr:valine--tRNA ligase [Xanthomonadales bacterium]MDH3923548.1 valine--tRNA ligase [Xanthomonadales bacterium]MDH4001688.1 valine--tRNA ligase [Xanthomonadales bacterium]
MEKSYNPTEIERRWYSDWEDNSYFKPAGGSHPYCIMLPPPNVTGRLHMGHAFQDTIMDTLTRWQRMKGADTLWQPGTDHAGIATQMVVERQLLAEGKSRHELGRDKFVEAVWDWKEHSGDTIGRQMRRLGTSVDWSRHRFTMDAELSTAVQREFITLYEEGLIYRGKRLVNWDPVLHTALSDLEVISEEEKGFMWHIRYPRSDGGGHLVVATTRPETLLGDTAVAVHPDDERYADLVGQQLELPLTGRTIPVIADDYVDSAFGSGCVKITPAHDFNDYDIGKRHSLPLINVLDIDARLNENAPQAYRGLDRFEARKKIVEDLESLGLLEKIEDHSLMIPRGDRSHAVVEPYLTDQWYVKIEPLARPAIEAVEDGRIEFVPANWSKTYFDWMYRIEDWCISRQLWWGHRIPAWYDPDGNIHVGTDEEDARQRSGLAADVPLQQDEDVLDTWFSSALWPFSTLGWPAQTEDLKRFYPSSVLVTGFDIIFFWVARMIMMGLKFMDDVPFRTVYIHGLIRDGHGQKMSKSKGNVLDPIDLIDGIELEQLVRKRTTGLMQPQMAPAIEKMTRQEFPDGIPPFGTDALRFTFAALATTGRDIRFDLGRIEGYRNFCNKLWNAARFVLMQTEGKPATAVAERSLIDRWIVSRMDRMIREVEEHFGDYRLDLAAQALYEFVWNEYCDWYLEFAKATLQNGTDDEQATTRHTLLTVLETSLRTLHPIMPFITEEIWQRVKKPLGIEGDTIMLRPFPEAGPIDEIAEADVDWLRSVIQGIRRIRSELNLPPSKGLEAWFQDGNDSDRLRQQQFAAVLSQLARIQSAQWVDTDADTAQCAVALVGDLKILIPLKGLVNVEEELARLGKQLDRENADLKKSEGKLSNSRFTENAPEAVVAQERERLVAHRAAVENLQEQIQQLQALQD